MMSVSVEDLARDRDSWFVLDVREPDEIELAAIGANLQIPLGELESRTGELPGEGRIAVLCHHGVRSARAAAFLLQRGYSAVNIEGGIEAWSLRVDPAVARY